MTALHSAAWSRNADSVRILLNSGLQVDSCNSGISLHLAADEGCREAVRLLIDRGADMKVVDENGNSVLHTAAFAGNVEL
jgi:ankyrin repeat protein